LEAVKPWSEKGIEGVHRFLKKVHRECLQTEKHLQGEESNKETLKVLHETILKVTEAIEDLRFNVAISQMMILINQLQKVESYSLETIQSLLQLLAPFAPHLSGGAMGKVSDGNLRLSTNPGRKHEGIIGRR
jgi:leucyl-tRNA synthetase